MGLPCPTFLSEKHKGWGNQLPQPVGQTAENILRNPYGTVRPKSVAAQSES